MVRPYAAANELTALDDGSETVSGGIIEELLESLFGTSSRLQSNSADPACLN